MNMIKPHLQFSLKQWSRPASVVVVMIALVGCASGEPTPLVTVRATEPASPIAANPATLTPVTRTPTTQPSRTATTTVTPRQPTLTATSTATPGPNSFTRQRDVLPALPSPTPIATPAPRVQCIAQMAAPDLRAGPGKGYDLIRTLPAGTALSALKCAPGGTWLLVETPQQEIGWLPATSLSCQADLASLPIAVGLAMPGPTVLPPAAPPTPTPSPSPPLNPTPAPAVGYWQAEYYDNASLLGEPVVLRTDPELDFNWLLDSPAPGIPADNFSARWTRQFEFVEAGDYKFFADVDDGVKVYINGWLIIDEWHTGRPVVHTGVFADIQPGLHTVTVEYFESGGHARIKVWAEKTTLVNDEWIGEYYNNPDWQGSAFRVRQDEDIDFDWEREAPISGMDRNDFSVRWRRTLFLDEGDYTFRAEVADEDRVKIYLDDWLIADEYKEGGGTVKGYFNQVGGGYHTVKVEYQDDSGQARIKFRWERD